MSQNQQSQPNQPPRSSWFDPQTSHPLIDQQAQRLESLAAAMADGVVDDAQLKAQEGRVVDLMRQIEPQLAPALHDQVTRLLVELTAYDIMRLVHEMHKARPATVFQG